MPWCQMFEGRQPTLVDSAEDCRLLRGKIVEGPTGDKKEEDNCFIRSVLTRALGELILDLGVAKELSAKLAREVDIPRKPAPKGGTGERKFLTLTPTLRSRLATRVMRSILNLANTYKTGLEFRVNVFMPTPRGRQVLDYYHRYLPEIYEIARNDYALLNDLASAWLEVYPFVTGMVKVVTAGENASANMRRRKLSTRSYDAGQDLIRRFSEASNDSRFQAVTREFASELSEYRDLDAEQAVAKLRASNALRGGAA